VNRDYLLITPVRDEIEYARRTLDSVCNQTVKPAKWMIVDDGSTDGTTEVLREYEKKYPFIQVHQRKNRGERKVGPGVIEAFYEGWNLVENRDRYAYSCKLDLDLDLPLVYFERLIQMMEANPRLGTVSGKPYFPGPSNTAKNFEGELISEACGDEMSVGMTKFYRREAFEQIGGYVREVMWDGIDCHQCRRMGWQAMSVDESELRFIHLRPMGSSHKGIVTGRKRHGFGQYFMGTSLLYMTASAAYRTLRPPYGVGGAAMLLGYLESMAQRKDRYGDEEFRKFLRRYQYECLVLGKKKATERCDARQAAVWNPGTKS
jgi:poly-beta-1,6-N-acetyl-D-glucosamine synthase